MFFFFFNDTATTEIYTLSLHDALPIFHIRAADGRGSRGDERAQEGGVRLQLRRVSDPRLRLHPHGLHLPRKPEALRRSEEHTSELQSRQYLVCRLLLEKKKNLSFTCFC